MMTAASRDLDWSGLYQVLLTLVQNFNFMIVNI